MDPLLEADLRKAAIQEMDHCLNAMKKHWLESGVSGVQMKKDWAELLSDTRKLPLKFKIQQARVEINKMWDMCFKSEEERRAFAAYHSDIYTETLLKEHLEELGKLKHFYDENKDLIVLISKYEEMWNCVMNIQQQAHNPERLFKNRGAKLLQEEQDRKLISKIPHMQGKIMAMIREKASKGCPFLIRGEQFANIVERHKHQTQTRKTLKRSPLHQPRSVEPSAKKKRLNEKTPNGIQERKAARCLMLK